MHKLTLKKPDGRLLYLYSRNPILGNPSATVPPGESIDPNPHMRWHPLRGEWVAYAAYRQHRTFLPPPEYNPLAPTTDPDHPTELPQGDYDVAVFDNRFPSLFMQAEDPPLMFVETRPARGVCEVVVYAQSYNTSLGQLPLSHIRLLVDVWADRYEELGSRGEIQYVMPFENRGVEVGVTLHHPHGQIYAYPVVPPIARTELLNQLEYLQTNGSGLVQDLVASELKDSRRIIFHGDYVAAFVPVCARYPYEVWIAPILPRASLAQFSDQERNEFARALKTVLLKFDGLWKRPFPYIMVFHQAPTDGEAHPEAHFHVEFYPPYRTESKLKYLAGTEIGAGLFTSDTLPEEKAAELKRVEVDFESEL